MPTILAAFVLVCGSLAPVAKAQDYPTRPVRVFVPFAVGGASDIMGRVLAQRLSDLWGTQVLIENRTGADGRIGTEAAAKSPPDGYSLLIVDPSFAIAPGYFDKLPYDTARDFVSISALGKAPQVLVVHPSFPAKSFKEFLAIAKAKPGELNYGTPGRGSSGHLSGELLASMAHVSFTHIPYKGASAALADLLAAQLGFAFVSVSSALPNVKSGKLRALAVTSTGRFFSLPEVPSLDESGVTGYETIQWWGVVAPVGTPRALVSRLNADVLKVMGTPEAKQSVASLGAEVSTGTPEQFAAYLAMETAKWSKVVKDANLKPE